MKRTSVVLSNLYAKNKYDAAYDVNNRLSRFYYERRHDLREQFASKRCSRQVLRITLSIAIGYQPFVRWTPLFRVCRNFCQALRTVAQHTALHFRLFLDLFRKDRTNTTSVRLPCHVVHKSRGFVPCFIQFGLQGSDLEGDVNGESATTPQKVYTVLQEPT